MERIVKREILALLDTISEGTQYINTKTDESTHMILEDCIAALNRILNSIRAEVSTDLMAPYEKLITSLVGELTVWLNSENKKACYKSIKNKLFQVKKSISNEPCPLEILFLPYKASMWDSMESIWIAANQDPKCNAYVMPIPYYDRNPDGSFGQFHYEGHQLPSGIPIVDYKQYTLSKRCPEVIYIHNNYDGTNRVTSVAPEYYSDQLKLYTDMLVFVPYYIYGCAPKAGALGFITPTPACYHVTQIVAQSEVVKKGLSEVGIPENRIAVLGNPKLDAAALSCNFPQPIDWLEKAKEKTCFLVNTSLTTFLNQAKWLQKTEYLFRTLLDDNSCMVIWRPHPLLENTIRSMRQDLWDKYQTMRSALLAYDNLILDDTSDIRYAFSFSDALISDYSSVLFQYGVTGKPVLCLNSSKNEVVNARYLMFDFSEYYFCLDGISIKDFRQMICNGQDPKHDMRMKKINNSVKNPDGTAGSKIHTYMLEKLKLST